METQRKEPARHFYCVSGGKTEPLPTARPHTIILADDHALVRREIRKIIERSPNLKVWGEAGDGIAALDLLKEFIPDLVILDISMPRCSGLQASREIKRLYPGLKVMILTMHRDEEYRQYAMALGVDAYVLKESSADELTEAIFALLEDQTFFSNDCEVVC